MVKFEVFVFGFYFSLLLCVHVCLRWSCWIQKQNCSLHMLPFLVLNLHICLLLLSTIIYVVSANQFK